MSATMTALTAALVREIEALSSAIQDEDVVTYNTMVKDKLVIGSVEFELQCKKNLDYWFTYPQPTNNAIQILYTEMSHIAALHAIKTHLSYIYENIVDPQIAEAG
jgi:hypothetical protein